MSRGLIEVNDALYEYLLQTSLRESDLLRALREETALDAMARMQISPDQGQFMSLLVKLLQPMNCLEIGTFTGYSSLCIAQAMPESARLLACDISKEWTDVAQRYWQQAGVAHKIQLKLAPALETLQQLSQQPQFDFIFVDADKEHYVEYYQACLPLLNANGLLIFDNALWSGTVIDLSNQQPATIGVRRFNDYIAKDFSVDVSLIAVGDGLFLIRKK